MRIILFSLLALLLNSCSATKSALQDEPARPRLVVTTDINIQAGDPDDRQSLAHLFLYADEIDVRGIVVDRPDARGFEACDMVVECYREDYENENNHFAELGYPAPDTLASRIYRDHDKAVESVIAEALKPNCEPLYIAAWGNMNFIKECLDKEPKIAKNIRILTIGTELKAPADTKNCGERNWNDMSGAREKIFNDPRFNDIWWIENNWGYSGMCTGNRPAEFMREIYKYGALGRHITEAMQYHAWAQYFRVGDTPTVMYFIDNKNLDNPLEYNLGGYFTKPYPTERPNYYIDSAEGSDWNYADPCQTWDKAQKEVDMRAIEMQERRDAMYVDFVEKLEKLY